MTSFIDDDGNELQYDGSDFALTKQVLSLFDLSIRSNTSVNISIPANAVNRRILNFYRFNQHNGSQLVSQTFNLIRNGNKIDRGSIVLIDDDGDELKVFFASGNFKWFGSMNFRCNEIRTTKWDVRWNNYYIANRYNATDGIIIPIIDWNFRHQKFSQYISMFQLRVGDGSLFTLDSYIPESYPCLYVHTLVSELANHSQVNIKGTLLEDAFFKKLILTPQGARFKNPVTGEPVFTTRSSGIPIDTTGVIETEGVLVKPEMIAPNMIAIDFIKFLSVAFGCIISFDETKNTINLDIASRLDKADAEDWSEYYVSHTEEYKNIKRNNYILYKESVDADVDAYNASNSVDYGGINIESGRDDASERTVYTAPFPAAYDKVGSAYLRMATPYVPFVTLEDQEYYEYTSVTDLGSSGAGVAPGDRSLRFNGTGFPFTLTSNDIVVRILDDNGLYSGFHVGTNGGAGSTFYDTIGAFLGTSTGKIYIQSATKNDDQYILVAVPGVTSSDISVSTQFWNRAALSNIATAYFSKPDIPYASALNLHKRGLAFGPINLTGYNDVALKDSYLTPLVRGIVQPTLKTKMRIPLDVFAKFDGSRLIYLNTGTLNGYFVVEKIEHYDENAPDCNVYISIFE